MNVLGEERTSLLVRAIFTAFLATSLFFPGLLHAGEHVSGGVTRPTPRFTDNDDGTVIDNHSGLIWLKNANRFGKRTWDQAMNDCKNLADDGVTLKDGSSASDWRLPTVKELEGLVDRTQFNPALPARHPFVGVENFRYWTSIPYAISTCAAWDVGMGPGGIHGGTLTVARYHVWPVRGGEEKPSGGTHSQFRGLLTMATARSPTTLPG